MPDIHPTAVIDTQAEIAADVRIGPFTVIEGPVRIGAGCHIYHSVYLTGDCQIGEGCVIHPFATIGHLPQDFAFDRSTRSSVVIGDGCEIREGVTIHRGTKPDTVTTLGKRVYLMAYCHVAHNCRVDDDVIVANGSLLAGYVEVGKKAFISGNVSIHQFVRIGQYAMISASTYLNKDVPPFCIASGVPAAIAGINVVGMRRGGYDQDARNQVKDMFKLLYRSRLNVSEAVARMEQETSTAAIVFRDFIRASKRGLTRRARCEAKKQTE